MDDRVFKLAASLAQVLRAIQHLVPDQGSSLRARFWRQKARNPETYARAKAKSKKLILHRNGSFR
jgi:hypothetical protein